jgi:ABC-type multidrug transport system fused ATPase/permease subunit
MADIAVTLKGKVDGSFTGMFSKATGYITNFKNAINTQMFNTLGASAMAGKAISTVEGNMKAVTSEAKQAIALQAQTGMPVESVAKLGKIADEVGTSQRAIIKGYQRMKSQVSSALIDPLGEAGKRFERLGISQEELQQAMASGNMEGIFGRVSDAVNGIGDEADQVQAKMDMFGPTYMQINGLIEKGNQGQEELRDKTQATSEFSINQNKAMGDSWEKMWNGLKKFFGEAGVVLNFLTQVVRILFNIFSGIVVIVGGVLLIGLMAVASVVMGLVSLGASFARTFTTAGSDADKFFEGLQKGAEATFNATNAVINGVGNQIVTDAKDIGESFSDMGGYDANKKPKPPSKPNYKSDDTIKAEKKAQKELDDAQQKLNSQYDEAEENKRALIKKRMQLEEEYAKITDKGSVEALTKAKEIVDVKLEEKKIADDLKKLEDEKRKADQKSKDEQAKKLQSIKEKEEEIGLTEAQKLDLTEQRIKAEEAGIPALEKAYRYSNTPEDAQRNLEALNAMKNKIELEKAELAKDRKQLAFNEADAEKKKKEQELKEQQEDDKKGADAHATTLSDMESLNQKISDSQKKKAGATDEELAQEEINREKAKLQKLEQANKAYKDNIAKGGKATAEGEKGLQEEIRLKGDILDKEDKITEATKKAPEEKGSKGGVVADAMRRIGGGGRAFSQANEHLAVAKSSDKKLAECRDLLKLAVVDKVNGDYSVGATLTLGTDKTPPKP